jgi:ribosomal protein S7
MRTPRKKTPLPTGYYGVSKLIQVLLRKGNKARSYRFVRNLFIVLKRELCINQRLTSNNPLTLLDKALVIGAPVFTYKRVFVSGKLFEIPIPIHPNRGYFMACYWLREIIRKKSHSDKTINLLPKEVMLLLNKKGDLIKQLNSYTADGVEKNIFKKYLRRKRVVISRSKAQTKNKAILTRINKTIRKKKFTGTATHSAALFRQISRRHKGRARMVRDAKFKK